jgi:hypothetical protein
MANPILPVEERSLTPNQVAQLDRRRRRGQLYLVMGFQFTLVGLLVTLFAGQDMTYAPTWHHPMGLWDAILFVLAIIAFVRGVQLRRGVNEFFSY